MERGSATDMRSIVREGIKQGVHEWTRMSTNQKQTDLSAKGNEELLISLSVFL